MATDDDIEHVFVQNVVRLRQQAGLSQETLADRAGLSREYMGRLERTKKPSFTIRTAKQIARALNTTVVELLSPAKRRP